MLLVAKGTSQWRKTAVGIQSSGSLRKVLLFVSSIFFGVLSIAYFTLHPPLHWFYPPAVIEHDPTSVYVPGAGFSGFWFTFGALQKIDSTNHTFYCYSSGCLVVLAKVLDTSFNQTYGICDSIKQSVQLGTMSRYNAVAEMFESLTRDIDDDSAVASLEFLQKINVLITSKDEGVIVRKATTLLELKSLLVSTTWIPFVTGNGLWATNENGGHIDGAFSKSIHPQCMYRCGKGIPLSSSGLQIKFNALNMNLDIDQVRSYWELGQQQPLVMNPKYV